VLPVSGRGGSLEIATGWLHRGEADACLCVACDLMDKRFAASMLSPHDAPGEAWQSCAVWIGRPTGAGREHPLGSDSLPRLARSLVASGVPARNPGAGVS
jgi:hypothetical protein